MRIITRFLLVVVCTLPAAAELPVRTPAAEATATTRIRVKLSSVTGKPLLGKGFVVFKGSASPTPVVVPTTLPGPAEVDLPRNSQWTLIVDFPDYFAANSIVQVAPSAQPEPLDINVVLRAAGTLTGKFVVGEKEALPDRLEARFEATRLAGPRKQDIPPGLATCAIGQEGEWRCRLPAGSLDVALHPRGFVPHYLWNTPIKAGEAGTLETKRLVRGASIAGWIAKEDGTPAEKCLVRLEPLSAPGRGSDPVLEFLRSVASEAPCQNKGFFQFSAVSSGSYTIVAQDGDAQAQLSPVEVWEGSESRISVPITLRKAMDFQVTLSPPVDWLGKPWRLEARRVVEYRSGWEDPSFRAEASPEGQITIPKRPPGRFWITVYDGAGNAVFSDSHVELTDSTQAYPIALDLLWIKGRVALGDAPVDGRLVFSGRSDSASVTMRTDEDGSFEGPLPKPGTWRVDIEASEPRLKTCTRVEVKPKGGTVEIDLPNTRVYGKVVTPAGSPAPGAIVTFSSTVGTLEMEADSKGEFEIRAFPEGSLEISAARTAGQGSREVSDAYRFEATEDSPHGPVILALQRNKTMRGKVLAAMGPVVGASVLAWPAEGGDGVASNAQTRLDGTFQIEVPAGTQSVRVIVSPPGGALKSYEVPISGDAELLFQVEPIGGELVVAVGDREGSGDLILAVWQGDIGIPLGALIHWTEGLGKSFFRNGQVRIPQLAPGFYTVCRGAAAMIDPGTLEEWKGRGACDSGYLAAASALELSLK